MGDDPREHAMTHQIAVFSVSAAMAGVCLSAISTVLLLKSLARYETLCDLLFMIDMLFFLLAALFSYLAFRLRFRRRWKVLHVAADVSVLLGMVLMVASTGLLIWVLV